MSGGPQGSFGRGASSFEAPRRVAPAFLRREVGYRDGVHLNPPGLPVPDQEEPWLSSSSRGASSGFGLESSLAFARHGDRVYATMRNLAGAGRLRAEAEAEWAAIIRGRLGLPPL
ncbi:MAG: hypothetical protein ACRDJF_07695 [Actinomycetota bacterium]